MNDLPVLRAIEIVERYLDELFVSGYYNDSEVAEFESAWSVVLSELKV